MELRHIRSFLAVAEERSFTRAAARLGVTQPFLSTQIRQLERQVGVSLFRRLPQGAELSAAGAAFFQVMRDMPGTLERGLNAARRIARGEAGAITLGFTASSIFNPVVTDAIAAFRAAYPEVALKLEEANTTLLLRGLREGSVDAAFLRPRPDDAEGLVVSPLGLEAMVAVLHASHHLAKGAAIALSDLAADPLLLFPREVGPRLFDIVVEACRRDGFEPRLGQTTPQIASILNLVAAGLGVAIIPASMGRLTSPAVARHAISGAAPRAPLAFARGAVDASPVVANLEAIVRGRGDTAPNKQV